MNPFPSIRYNFHKTLLGGQAFSWDFIDGAYYGVVGDQIIKILPQKGEFYWQTYPQKDNWELVKDYLRLDVDYENVIRSISKDPHMEKAMLAYPDLRIISSPFEQTLISYLISSNKNIPGIRSCTRKLSERFGEKIAVDGLEFYTFPKTERLAEASVSDIAEAKVGFRAKYIKGTAEALIKDNLIEKIVNFAQVGDETGARTHLTSLYGVGDKIADCVMSYSLKFDNVTALDIWAKRFCKTYYGVESNKYEDVRKWTQHYFNGYAAWGGQFLFEYIREHWLEYKDIANTKD